MHLLWYILNSYIHKNTLYREERIALYRPRPNYSNHKDEVCYLLQQSIGGYFPLSFTLLLHFHFKFHIKQAFKWLRIKKCYWCKPQLLYSPKKKPQILLASQPLEWVNSCFSMHASEAPKLVVLGTFLHLGIRY